MKPLDELSSGQSHPADEKSKAYAGSFARLVPPPAASLAEERQNRKQRLAPPDFAPSPPWAWRKALPATSPCATPSFWIRCG